MRPCAQPPLTIRGAVLGGEKPLLCVPLVARDEADLLEQARAAHALAPDVVEWRADSWEELSAGRVRAAAADLRDILTSEPIIFTLRAPEEGGARPILADARRAVILDVISTGLVDIVDIELFNGPRFIEPLAAEARRRGVRVILSFHDFEQTPANEVLERKVTEMARLGADIAKVACMPRDGTRSMCCACCTPPTPRVGRFRACH
jgi:3-dehydroquinate dehydratase-1